MNLVQQVNICEVGLRDGLQSLGKTLTTDQKVEIIDDLVASGFKTIEVGSFVHPKAVPQMEDTDEVFRRIKQVQGVEYRALVPNLRGVLRAIDCGCKKVKLNVSASKSHNLANLNRIPSETVASFAESVELASQHGIDISGSISMAFGSPWDKEIPFSDITEIVDAYLAVGINEISLSDASGMAYPSQVYQIANEIKSRYPSVDWWFHFHNTRGLGLANILAGMASGITNYDASLGGIGGCPFVPGAAGNVSTEDLIHMLDLMTITSGIDLDQIIKATKKMIGFLEITSNSYVVKAGKTTDLVLSLPQR